MDNACCFTGHRLIPKGDLSRLSQRLCDVIAELIAQNITFFIVGGAVGFDTLAAFAVIKARKKNPKVKLIMALPCHNQDAKWSDDDKQTYRKLLEFADKIIYVSENYSKGCMAKRNLYLVQHSSVCVAYKMHERSGTSQTVRLSKENGVKVINLAEN